MIRFCVLLICLLSLSACKRSSRVLFPIFKYGKYGFIDQHGEIVIPPQFKIHRTNFYSKDEIFRPHVTDSLYKLINSPNPFKMSFSQKKEFVNTFQECYPDCEVGSFINKRAAVNCDWKYGSGFIDRSGNPIAPFDYWFVSDFQDGIAFASKGPGELFLVDTNGQHVIRRRFGYGYFDHFVEGIILLSEQGRWSYLDKEGTYIWREDWDLHHKNLDLSLWDLDTLQEHYVVENAKRIDQRNRPKMIPHHHKLPYHPTDVGLFVDTSQLTHFLFEFYAHKLFLYNTSSNDFSITMHSGSINLILQGWDEHSNQWIDLEEFMEGFCGNARMNATLPSNHHWSIPAPLYKGNMSTLLRYKLITDNGVKIFSNVYCGEIHSDWIKEGKSRRTFITTEPAVWAE